MRSAAEIEALVKDHQQSLLRYLRFLGADEALAQDMAQETFVAAINAGFADTDQPGTRAYLRTTARNFYFMWLRKHKHEVALPGDDTLESAWHDNEGSDFGETYIKALQNCLDKLTERARLALKMRYGDNASREQISFATGLDSEGAKTLLRRSKEKLRECIARQIGQDHLEA